MTDQILVAGIGNVFRGDDAFGVKVAQRLLGEEWPEGVQVAEFGIRSYDLAYALTDGYDAAILVDAAERGKAPGTVFVLEPDLASIETETGPVVNAHSLNPVRILQLVHRLDGPLPEMELYVVACEPQRLEPIGGELELSEPVRAAVPRAAATVRSLVARLADPAADERRPRRAASDPKSN